MPEFLSSPVQQLYRHKLPEVNILELEFILINTCTCSFQRTAWLINFSLFWRNSAISLVVASNYPHPLNHQQTLLNNCLKCAQRAKGRHAHRKNMYKQSRDTNKEIEIIKNNPHQKILKLKSVIKMHCRGSKSKFLSKL